MNIAVVGSRGYVGTSLLKSFSELPFAKITSVTRDNFQQFSKSQFNKSFDVLIYAASPAGRLRAENDPSWDYQETVCKSKWFLDNYRFGLVILISTISVSLAPMSKYGLHRKEVEERVIGVGGRVVRLGPLYGGKPRNSTLQEIVDNKQVFSHQKQSTHIQTSIWFQNIFLNIFTTCRQYKKLVFVTLSLWKKSQMTLILQVNLGISWTTKK